jgi:hypothetical protein
MWMLRGSRAWSQWGVVHRFHVLLACRKFWLQPRRCLPAEEPARNAAVSAVPLTQCSRRTIKARANVGDLFAAPTPQSETESEADPEAPATTEANEEAAVAAAGKIWRRDAVAKSCGTRH